MNTFKQIIKEENNKVKQLIESEQLSSGKCAVINFEGSAELAETLPTELKKLGINSYVKEVDDNYVVKTDKTKTSFDWNDNDECLTAIENIVKSHGLFSYGLYADQTKFDGGDMNVVIIATTEEALQDGIDEMQEFMGD